MQTQLIFQNLCLAVSNGSSAILHCTSLQERRQGCLHWQLKLAASRAYTVLAGCMLWVRACQTTRAALQSCTCKPWSGRQIGGMLHPLCSPAAATLPVSMAIGCSPGLLQCWACMHQVSRMRKVLLSSRRICRFQYCQEASSATPVLFCKI